MDKVLATLRAVLDKADALLQGEPARAIGYGSAVVVIGVVTISNALGFTRFQGVDIDLGSALVLVTAATTTVVGIIEGIRKFVFSPASVAAIVTTPPAAAGPIAAAEAEGVDVAAAAADDTRDSS